MQPAAIKDFIREQIVSAKSDYAKDLEAMTHEQLGTRPKGSARSPYDFTFEVVFVNKRIAKRLRGETPEPVPEDSGWMTAPDSFQNKEQAKKEMDDSMQEILDAFDKVPADDLGKTIQLPASETSAFKLGYFAAHHANYHDAQLNYIQSLNGDEKVHWGS